MLLLLFLQQFQFSELLLPKVVFIVERLILFIAINDFGCSCSNNNAIYLEFPRAFSRFLFQKRNVFLTWHNCFINISALLDHTIEVCFLVVFWQGFFVGSFIFLLHRFEFFTLPLFRLISNFSFQNGSKIGAWLLKFT